MTCQEVRPDGVSPLTSLPYQRVKSFFKDFCLNTHFVFFSKYIIHEGLPFGFDLFNSYSLDIR